MKRVIVRKLRFVPVDFRWSVICPACRFSAGARRAAVAIDLAGRCGRTHRKDQS